MDSNKDTQIKKQVFLLILIVAGAGMIVPFATQFILPFFFPEVQIAGVEVWNQFVSIILGVVATIMSIVSLYLCFKSEEQAHATEIRTQQILSKISNKVELVYKQQEQIYKSVSKNNDNNLSADITNQNNWNAPSDEKIVFDEESI